MSVFITLKYNYDKIIRASSCMANMIKINKLAFMHYVYSLKCKNGYYIGCTGNLKDRLKQHQNGYVPATKKHLPVELNCYFAFQNKYIAFKFEKYLKSGSGRAFIKKHF